MELARERCGKRGYGAQTLADGGEFFRFVCHLPSHV
jgi:hypothetical protein